MFSSVLNCGGEQMMKSTHRIHVWYIYRIENHNNQRNPWIGKYTKLVPCIQIPYALKLRINRPKTLKSNQHHEFHSISHQLFGKKTIQSDRPCFGSFAIRSELLGFTTSSFSSPPKTHLWRCQQPEHKNAASNEENWATPHFSLSNCLVHRDRIACKTKQTISVGLLNGTSVNICQIGGFSVTKNHQMGVS